MENDNITDIKIRKILIRLDAVEKAVFQNKTVSKNIAKKKKEKEKRKRK